MVRGPASSTSPVAPSTTPGRARRARRRRGDARLRRLRRCVAQAGLTSHRRHTTMEGPVSTAAPMRGLRGHWRPWPCRSRSRCSCADAAPGPRRAAPGLAPAQRRLLETRVPLYRRVPAALRAELDARIAAWIARVEFVGCNGLEVNERDAARDRRAGLHPGAAPRTRRVRPAVRRDALSGRILGRGERRRRGNRRRHRGRARARGPDGRHRPHRALVA